MPDNNGDSTPSWKRSSPDRSSKTPERSPQSQSRGSSEDRGQKISIRERLEKFKENESKQYTKSEPVVAGSISSLRSAFEKQDSREESHGYVPKRVIRDVDDIPSFRENMAEQRDTYKSVPDDFSEFPASSIRETIKQYNSYDSEVEQQHKHSYSNSLDEDYPEQKEEPSYESRTNRGNGYYAYQDVDESYQAVPLREEYLSDSSETMSSNHDKRVSFQEKYRKCVKSVMF